VFWFVGFFLLGGCWFGLGCGFCCGCVGVWFVGVVGGCAVLCWLVGCVLWVGRWGWVGLGVGWSEVVGREVVRVEVVGVLFFGV
ncbi:hypothetical protein, partial [Pseudomonas syringae group genomosp. 7]|uniref:hypothetical protein n=1 Tax=Pseudomonas syringae group genomosp. 7 TaxID=251699 RepID=UPI00376FA5E3